MIEAPVREVWELVGDPRRYPEWAGEVIEVTGVASLDEGETFNQTGKLGPFTDTTVFEIDAREELREIRLTCTKSGYYSHWLLTEAQGGTFADVEIGMDPKHAFRAYDLIARRWYRGIVEDAIAGIRHRLER